MVKTTYNISSVELLPDKCKIIVYKGKESDIEDCSELRLYITVEDNSLLICNNKNDNFENLWLSNRMNCSLKSANIVKFEVFPKQENENHV